MHLSIEAIHPFNDGNGRNWTYFILALLKNLKKMLDTPAIYLSELLLKKLSGLL